MRTIEGIRTQDRDEGAVSEPEGSRASALVWVILGVGLALRSYDLVRPYSLWADEAKLALNVVGKGVRELIGQRLSFGQVAPPGFLAMEKLAVVVFGPSEFGLRVVPFAAGVASLALAWWLTQELRLRRGISLAFLSLVAISPYLVLFSTDAKPYSVEAAITLLVCVAWARFRARPDARRAVVLGLVGGCTAWFSFGVFFVFCGVASAAAWMWARRKVEARILGMVLAPWILVASPAAVFDLSVHGATRDFMQRYWQAGFLPFPPTSLAQVRVYGRAVLTLFAHPGGFQATPWLGLASFLVACAVLGRRDTPLMLLLSVPLMALVAAAALRLYPIGGESSPVQGRVVLWSAPLLLFGAAYGACWVGLESTRLLRPVGLLAIGALFVESALHVPGYVNLYRGLRVRRAAQVVAQHRPRGEPVYTSGLLWSPMEFYGRQMGLEELGTPINSVKDTLSAPRIWLLHYGFEGLPPGLRDSIGREIGSLAVPGVRGSLVEWDPSGR